MITANDIVWSDDLRLFESIEIVVEPYFTEKNYVAHYNPLYDSYLASGRI